MNCVSLLDIFNFSKLYWVDAWNKTIMISNLNGRNPATLVNVGAIVGQNPIFGLAIPDSRTALVSAWNMVISCTFAGNFAVHLLGLVRKYFTRSPSVLLGILLVARRATLLV